MSQAELDRPHAPTEAGSWELLTGWGRTGASRARIVRAESPERVASVLAGSLRERGGVIARGAGRSYGDAAQNRGGTVLDITGLRGALELDPAGDTVRAGAGTTFAELLVFLARHGRTLPVVPGTRHLTLGGAIASDVHGKNHVRDGSLARHVESFTLCTPADGPTTVSAQLDRELFEASFGGMGLTGVVLDANLRTAPLDASHVLADNDRTDSLEDALALMADLSRHRYAIAWVDLLAQGAAFGRSIVTRSGEHAPLPPSRSRRLGHERDAGPFPASPRIAVPRGFPAWVLRPETVRAFNALRWRSCPRRELGRAVSVSAHLFPLDALGDWNRLYGPGGLAQYQFAVPTAAEGILSQVAGLLRQRRLPMYLAVLKRFGPGSGGPLSFPIEGWTLAIDMPAQAPGMHSALQEADELVAAAGGRVYLAKDARLPADTLELMYPSVSRFRELRARVDPRQRLRSDMARRLDLCE